jgi:hypothetical protein
MNRTFKPLRTPSGKGEAFGLAWGERFDESGINWDELLRSQRILIVSEAGAGKTYECETKARELFARGEPAFFLSLESVAFAGVAATLFGDEHKRFTDWLASSSQVAYFFLDSIVISSVHCSTSGLALDQPNGPLSWHLRNYSG